MTLNALFVYGTLMRGESSHDRIRGFADVEAARVEGRLFDLGPHPALVLGGGVVFGELYVFDDLTALLPDLDAYEGYDPLDPEGSLYVRRILDVEARRLTPAYGYVMRRAPAGAVEIHSGRWADRGR